MKEWFHRFAKRSSDLFGRPWAFVIAVGVLIGWAISGPIFHFSDTWQLVINTGTTIVTFLMVFLIQNTQNRDAKAIHLKLDELLRADKQARTGLVDLEDFTDEELDRLQKEFEALQQRYQKDLERSLEQVKRSRHRSAGARTARAPGKSAK